MLGNISVNTRSSIKITGTKTIYFDPLEINGTPHDADIVFITHEHYDHFSPADINKVLKEDTQIIVPTTMLDMVEENDFPMQNVQGIQPSQADSYNGVKCKGIASYNIDKQFHPKDNNWLGYVVELDGTTYYTMGDTDVISEAMAVDADVLFIPIGGKYTMDAAEAAAFINQKQPKLVIPIHYGDSEVCESFVKMINTETEIKKFW